MAKPLSGYVRVPGVGYVAKFDINQVYNNTKSVNSSTQVIADNGQKKKISFDKIFGFLERAVGLFGTIAEGIQKIKGGTLPDAPTDSGVYQEENWLGANPDGTKVDEGKNPKAPETKPGLNIELTSTNLAIGIAGLILAKKVKLI